MFETVETLFGLDALWFYYQMMQAGNLDINRFLHVHNAMSRPHEMDTRQKAKQAPKPNQGLDRLDSTKPHGSIQ